MESGRGTGVPRAAGAGPGTTGCANTTVPAGDLEAICKADQLQVVFQPRQMVPG